MEMTYHDFLNRDGDYGRTFILDKLRQQQFTQLDEQQHSYLNYTGANPYPRCLVNDME